MTERYHHPECEIGPKHIGPCGKYVEGGGQICVVPLGAPNGHETRNRTLKALLLAEPVKDSLTRILNLDDEFRRRFEEADRNDQASMLETMLLDFEDAQWDNICMLAGVNPGRSISKRTKMMVAAMVAHSYSTAVMVDPFEGLNR